MALPKSNYSQETIADSWLNEISKLVCSRQAISIAGTGTYTLSAAEYQATALELSGVLTGNRNVVVPADGGRVWWVYNNTTGAFTVTVKTPSGTGVTITQGKFCLVREDGTNVVLAQNDVTAMGLGTMATQNANAVAITGGSIAGITDLPVADGGTGSSTASAARTALGLAIGTDVCAQADSRFTGITGNNQTGTSYTLVLTDAGKCVEGNNASAITLTIPTNASVAFTVGTTIEIFQQGAGQITIAGAGGVTLRSNGGRTKLSGQYATAAIRQRATDEWVLSGDLTT